MLKFLEYCAGSDPVASIIWLHGLGADGSDFAPVAERLGLPVPVRFVFPHAPMLPVTVNGGYVMPAWYDIYALDIAARQDEAGIRNSQHAVEELVEREIGRGMAPGNIVLAGFSQGGAIALHTGLRFRERLAGIIALSCYLPLRQSLGNECGSANRGLPIFMAHGTLDTVIPVAAGRRSAESLKAAGFPVTWLEYPMPHSVCAEEISDIRAFLLNNLGRSPA